MTTYKKFSMIWHLDVLTHELICILQEIPNEFLRTGGVSFFFTGVSGACEPLGIRYLRCVIVHVVAQNCVQQA